MAVKGTTTGIVTPVLVPGIWAVTELDATLVGAAETAVMEKTIFVMSEPVEAKLAAVDVPVPVRPATGIDPPAVAPSVCGIGVLELTPTEPDKAAEVGITNEADRPAVEPSPCASEVLVVASSGPVEEEKPTTVDPDIEKLDVVATDPDEAGGVPKATEKVCIGKSSLVVRLGKVLLMGMELIVEDRPTLGKVLSTRIDPVVEDSPLLGKTVDCVVKSADEEVLLAVGMEPIGEETSTLETTGI